MLQPVAAYERSENDGEGHANHIVGNPSNCAFRALLWSSNIGMRKGSLWHVSEPAPDQTDVGWRDRKGMFEEHPPKIKGEGSAKSNEDYANEGESRLIHESS